MDYIVEAIQNGDTQLMESLLNGGLSPNSHISGFAHILQAAAWHSQNNIVTLLLRQGADVNLRHSQLGGALESAADQGYIKVVKTLLDWGADFDAQGGIYSDALNAAMRRGISGGHDYGSILEYAIATNNQKLVEELLERSASVNNSG
ncbi:ankyrin [Aspergillus japonicus CBS 114.51]|uniref:Ankyrin n=1 Tax=Aspergillus japonicus CBS 114.51 TaxID=1448312 RepID=A0A8T8X429_ASPJA|nr:ankyrin [Aspergillus japonicus CBS 114.51]RAH82816.1 ankyrin [Aspergillus japonicus CBS 114.51]